MALRVEGAERIASVVCTLSVASSENRVVSAVLHVSEFAADAETVALDVSVAAIVG